MINSTDIFPPKIRIELLDEPVCIHKENKASTLKNTRTFIH